VVYPDRDEQDKKAMNVNSGPNRTLIPEQIEHLFRAEIEH
jgi:hypothetical protein